MKKFLALILTCILLMSLLPAGAEEAGKYDLLTVGTTTAFSGNFLSDALGSNISDQDVRKLIHGYSLVIWDSASGAFQFNNRLMTDVTLSADKMTYTIPLPHNMTFNDGSPITARDYAFSVLMLGSKTMEEAAGGREDITRIYGGREYMAGEADYIAGIRIVTDHLISITIDPSYATYFYQLKALDIVPLPVSVLAPGCDVEDDGQGAYIKGNFSAETLKKTLLDPETGYVSHPSVTSGPYKLTGYDGNTVSLALNEYYLPDPEGNKPTIPQILIKVETPTGAIDDLAAGEIDLAVRNARESQIRSGMALMAGGDVFMEAYSRTGLAFISFCAEKGPTADLNVRKAIAMCMDKQTLTEQYLGAYGLTVKGYYGIGQWMFMMANGTLIPEEGAEEDWADLNMDSIPEYELNTTEAGELLEEAGWNLNEQGGAYAAGDGTRYRKEGDTLVPLKLSLIYPDGNGSGMLLRSTFIPYLNRAGISLDIKRMAMPELLKRYYRQVDRDCDMILLGTNFGDVFDPSGDYDENGTSKRNGITDPELAELSINMRNTEPGNAPEYCRRWLAYQARRSTIVAEVPLYSDAYLDFHIPALQNYKPGSTGNWAMAIQDAILSDYVAPAETEEEGEPDLGDDDFGD